MNKKLYKQMAHWGKQITTVLRHRHRKAKYGDGVTMDPEIPAKICSRLLNWELSVQDIWQIAQEGQGDGKSRVMVLIATHCDGSFIGWDKEKMGDEPAQTSARTSHIEHFMTKLVRALECKFLASSAFKERLKQEVIVSCGNTFHIGGIGR